VGLILTWTVFINLLKRVSEQVKYIYLSFGECEEQPPPNLTMIRGLRYFQNGIEVLNLSGVDIN